MAPVAKTPSYSRRVSLATFPYPRSSLSQVEAKSKSKPTPVVARGFARSTSYDAYSRSFQPTLYDMAFLLPSRRAQKPPVMERAKSSAKLQTPQEDLDEYYGDDIDLEHSFASNMSLNSPEHPSFELADDDSMAMDISPVKLKRDDSFTRPRLTRPRAYTGMPDARPFGRDLSNSKTGAYLEVPDAGPKTHSTSQAKPTRMPMAWTTYSPATEESLPSPDADTSDMMMDIDSSFQSSSAPDPTSPLSASTSATYFHDVSSPAPTKNFFDLSSPGSPPARAGGNNPFAPPTVSTPPANGPLFKARRSLSPEGTSRDDSYATLVSPSPAGKLRRMASGSLLAALCNASSPPAPGAADVSTDLDPSPCLEIKQRPRRPALNPLMPASRGESGRHSAYPILAGGERRAPGLSSFDAPERRSFSARLAPPGGMLADMSGDESSFDVSQDMMSSPAHAVARRAAGRALRRVDGSDNIRSPGPRSAGPVLHVQESPSARYLRPGMPGFGDNEAHGKILPCHRVKDDGLMRINPTTLNSLIDGAYDGRIHEFIVIDCRFEYEYNGGHVPGAININTTQGVEDYFLSRSANKPKQCTSADTSKKTILVFHCEFSAKRAPTFAKHLRSKDRAMNNHCYPKIHFPEVYVLEGGYCQYFKEAQPRCQPPAYVRMDDPSHAAARKEDLDQFRKGKFGRTRSYAYGDAGKMLAAPAPAQKQKRSSAPTAPPVFAAANAARSRRTGSAALLPVSEDGDGQTEGEEDETDIGDSPCPPPQKTMAFKGKKLGRLPLMRSETCGPLRF